MAAILNLLGCTGQTKENQSIQSSKVQEQLAGSIEEFKNRTIHTRLTEQTIDTTSDDDLLQVIFDNLSQKLPADYRKEYETVTSWNKSRQAIYMIWVLEGEVNNGGYNQYYYNSSGPFYTHLPQALRLVGANKFAAVTEKANEVFEKENEKIKEHQDGTLEGFSKSYEDNSLNKFDTEFYELYKTENLQQIQVDYIRKHKKKFIDN